MSDVGQRLIAEVNRVASENPDFVYRAPGDRVSCVYVRNGAPSCLVGHGLWNTGLIGAEFENLIQNGIKINTMGVGGALIALGVELDPEEVELLECIQDDQDCGTPWGECVS